MGQLGWVVRVNSWARWVGYGIWLTGSLDDIALCNPLMLECQRQEKELISDMDSS